MTPSKGVPARVRAANESWEASENDPEARSALRAAMQDILWNRAEPPGVRQEIARILMHDTTRAGMDASEGLASLMLPTEPDRTVVAEFARAAGEYGWTGASTGLVRRLATSDSVLPLGERVEAIALKNLHPGKDLTTIAYTVFLKPDVPAGEYAAEFARRARADAWAVASESDPQGMRRKQLLQDAVPQDSNIDSARDVELMRDGVAQIGVLPNSSMEFAWLRSLLDPTSIENTAWRRQVLAGLARLDPEKREGLAVRHLEPIRWALQHNPSWLDLSREALLAKAETRLAGRKTHTRREDKRSDRRRSRERLSDWSDVMSWGDLLTLIVTDEALQQVAANGRIFQFVRMDYEDKTAEYGGIIEEKDDRFVALLYPPRQRDRVNDTTFVASDDMIRQSDRAVAHFHMQVMAMRSYNYAGPSTQDLVYASDSGRTCVVFTSVGSDRVDVDYYQPDGVVVDLGEIEPAG